MEPFKYTNNDHWLLSDYECLSNSLGLGGCGEDVAYP